MKRNGILNLCLNQAIAAMGHGDYLIVCDAGFPIPTQVTRIDLAVVPDLPDIATVLTAINNEFIAEKVAYAAEMAHNNPRLKEKVDGFSREPKLRRFHMQISSARWFIMQIHCAHWGVRSWG
jgi:D-ribose pyranase